MHFKPPTWILVMVTTYPSYLLLLQKLIKRRKKKLPYLPIKTITLLPPYFETELYPTKSMSIHVLKKEERSKCDITYGYKNKLNKHPNKNACDKQKILHT